MHTNQLHLTLTLSKVCIGLLCPCIHHVACQIASLSYPQTLPSLKEGSQSLESGAPTAVRTSRPPRPRPGCSGTVRPQQPAPVPGTGRRRAPLPACTAGKERVSSVLSLAICRTRPRGRKR